MSTAVRWLDVHTHLNMLEVTPDEALSDAQKEGVDQVITIGTSPADWPKVLELAKTHFPRVACTLGVHPHEAELWNPTAKNELMANLNHAYVIAVGEIGLDYYYDNAPREIQKAAFREQMAIAAAASLPVEIHTRDAEEDTLLILQEFQGRVSGLLHCFTSSWALAEGALKLGYHISFSGVVTFKNADELRETCRKVPLNRIHVETDAPFLTPAPHRGRKNSPAMVVHTGQVVAREQGVSLEALSEATRANARTLFKRWPVPQT